jgi:photosystem II stability/assembly factor-like uncharacterized protein
MWMPRWVAAVMAVVLVAACSNKTAVAPLRPESVTFISPQVGLVIGLAPCGDVQCLRLAKTVDAGHSWTWMTSANLSSLAQAIPLTSATDQWRLRFADAENGWISGPLLLATHNGGRTWTRIELPGLGSQNGFVGALEAADGRVFAEVAEGTDQNTFGPVVLFSSAVSSDSWAAVESVTTGPAGYPGGISIAQGSIWAMMHPGVVTQQAIEAHSLLYHSSDGVTWHSSPLPCPPTTVASVAAATSSHVFIVCSGGVAAGSQDKTAYLSTDGGANYKRVGDPPFAGDFDEVAASPLAFAVAAASGATYIYTSFNDGHDWATTQLPDFGGFPLTDLGFTTTTQGVAIFGDPINPQYLQLLMTRDGGHTWKTIDVSPS